MRRVKTTEESGEVSEALVSRGSRRKVMSHTAMQCN